MSDVTDISTDCPASEPVSEAEGGASLPAASDAHADGAAALTQPMIAVALLTAHPGNVRRDLGLNTDFLTSIKENGVLVPLRITADTEGVYRVIDGHRRLAAAVRVGLGEVPIDLADDRAADEPGQFLDMWVAHRHRNALTPIEEADALFAAREAGATKARIRKSTGLKPPQVTAALAADHARPVRRRASAEAPAARADPGGPGSLAEFEGDPDAVDQLLDAARWHGTLDHQAERLRQERADKAEHERLCHELEDAGVTVTDALPPGGQLLAALRHEAEDLTPEAHAGCPGRGAFFRSYDPTAPVYYCADPAAHGHSLRFGETPARPAAAGAADAPGPVGSPEHGPSDAARRLVIEGNKAWKAASEVRRRWLTAELFARRTAPREAAPLSITRQLLAMADPLRSGLASAGLGCRSARSPGTTRGPPG